MTDNINKQLHKIHHDLANGIFNLTNWVSMLERARKKYGETLPEENILGVNHTVTVGQVYDAFGSATEKLRKPIIALREMLEKQEHLTNVLCIARYSNHCGHTLTFVSTETGKIIEEVYLPEGYTWTGLEWRTREVKRMEFPFKERVISKQVPTIKNLRVSHLPENIKQQYDEQGWRKYATGIVSIRCTRTWPDGYGAYEVEAIGAVAKVVDERCWVAANDTFKQEMAKLGFDMKGWCLYRRRKTHYKDFLKAITQGFHGYNVINIIEL